MSRRRLRPIQRSDIATRQPPASFTRTLERQIEDIMSQVAPRRQTDAPARGVVSVLFVTIPGFVALCEGIAPPKVGEILDVYLEAIADSAGKFLGVAQNQLNSTVVATWNAVYPQSDHALLAVNSAIDMVDRAEDVTLRLRARGLPEIRYGIGVNTGDALIGYMGPLRRQPAAVGDTVNVAELLCHLAGGGEICLGQGTQVSVGDQVLTEEVGVVQLHGKSKPERVFSVVRK